MTDISEDAPLRLKHAIKIAFPCGGMTESGLRQEHQKGRLKLEKIAGKHFVTLRAIKEMREICEQVPQRNVKLSPNVIYASEIPDEVMRAAVATRMQKRRDKLRKEIRERKRKEGYRVLGRD